MTNYESVRNTHFLEFSRTWRINPMEKLTLDELEQFDGASFWDFLSGVSCGVGIVLLIAPEPVVSKWLGVIATGSGCGAIVGKIAFG